MNRKLLLGTCLAGLAALSAPVGLAWANHVRIEVEGPVVTPPAVMVAPQTLQADSIRAREVRANTIYANKIEADQVQGAVFQTGRVKVDGARGDIRAPEVTASVIYADEIKANSVVADQIYVRSLQRR